MRLDYEAVWVDDQPTNIASMQNDVQSWLEDRGFVPRIRNLTSAAEFRTWAEANPEASPNLVVLDYSLGTDHDESGDVLADSARRMFQHSDVVFYSSRTHSELVSLIAKRGVDGVYCATRSKVVEVLKNRINGQLRRIGVAGVKGMIVDASAEIESTMVRVINIALSRPDLREPIGSHVRQVLKEKRESAEKTERSWDNRTSESVEGVTGSWYDSSAQVRTLLRIVNKRVSQLESAEELKDLLNWYTTKGSKLRNDFAHKEVSVGDDGYQIGEDRRVSMYDLEENRRQLIRLRNRLKQCCSLLQAESRPVE